MERLEEIRRKILPVLLPWGVKQVAVFGSFARGEDTPESDIDVLVELEEPRSVPLGFFTWVRLERELSRQLGKNMDLVSSKGLSHHIGPYVEAEMVVLYDKT